MNVVIPEPRRSMLSMSIDYNMPIIRARYENPEASNPFAESERGLKT